MVAGPLEPLTGYLRAKGTVWYDDAGPCAPRICSLFPAIRQYRDNPTLFARNLDAMMGYWHGARIFWCLRGAPWDQYQLEVDVTWPNYDALFVAVLREFKARNLRVALTSGTLHDHQLPNMEANFERVGRLAASVDQTTVITHAVINEPGMCSPYGDGYGGATDTCSEEPWKYYRVLLDGFRSQYPWGHHGTGCQGGDPEATENSGSPSGVIYGSRPPATHACVQGTRYPWQNALERAFDMGYNVRRAVGVPVWEEEPAGNDGGLPAVFQPMNDHDTLLAYYAIKLFTGQALTSLNSCGLWEQNPLDSVWGFKEIPQLLADIGLPDDIGTYQVGNLHKAPITASGVYRCDGAWHDGQGRAFQIVHGGTDWQLTSRWAGHVTLWRASGQVWEGPVSPGAVFYQAHGSPKPAVLVLEQV